MTKARFDPSGKVGVFLENIASSIDEGAKSVLLLACEKNGFTRELLDSQLKSLSIPVFGGVFPGIIYERKHYEKGSLVVPLPFDARVANIPFSPDEDFAERLAPFAEQLSSSQTVLVFFDAVKGNIGEFLDGVYDLLGTETKYLGGGAGSSDYTGGPCLFSNLGFMESQTQLVGISLPSEIEVSQGWQKLAGPFLVTDSGDNIVRTLDYKPAAEVYLEVVEEAYRGGDFFDFLCDIIDADENGEKRGFQDMAKDFPLGMEKDHSDMFICEPVAREGKQLVCRGNIPPLSPIYMLKSTPESLIDASRNAAKRMAGKMPDQHTHPFVFGCAGRSHYLQEKFAEEVGEIADAFETGLLGALTLGQVANGADGCLSLFNRSIVMGITGMDREARSQRAVNLVSMQHALTMLVSQSADLARILRHFLPQAIRLVNCRSAHVWLKDELAGEGLVHRLSYPGREQERLSDYPRLQERISSPLKQMEIVTENAAIFHVFPIGNTGVLVLRRNSPMPDELVLALGPAIHRLEEACLFAMHCAHSEKTRERALHDASQLLKELEHAKNREADLVESGKRLNFILESMPHFVCWKDEEMIYRGCNANFARLEGFESPEELIGKTEAEMPWRIEEIEGLNQEKMLRHVDGGSLWVSISAMPMQDGEGNASGVLIFFEDIGERKRMEADLRIEGSFFENAGEGVLILDSENRILKANHAMLKLTGCEEEALQGMEIGSWMPQIAENAGRIGHSIEKTGNWRGEIRGSRKDGEPFSAILNLCAVKNEEGIVTHCVAIFADITDRRKNERRLEDLAHFDPLTNLPNRTLLAGDLRKAILHSDRKGSIFALAFLDLDDFKPVNDQHGHETGDRLLIEVSGRLKNVLRGEDTVARLGGDEFVMLLTGIKDMSDVETTLTRVLSDLSSPYHIDGYVMHVTVSIGVTVYPFDNADADTLLRHADQAMYLAKQSGRNRFQWFDSKLDMALRAKQEKLSKLRFALERSELKLHYQPKINLRTGTVIGLEALIRWMHPEDGMIGPMAFLPLAEQTGLILDIGKWIIGEALGQMAKWTAQRIDFPVSVNVSAAHLKHPSFVETLEKMLSLHPEVPPSRLELEILETAFIDDFERVRETMISCQKLGVSFSLDDFGTGYSSLAYLKHLPVDTVKVDKTFVHDMKENTEDISIIEGVISLARIFSRMVIAEGVETSEHGMLLVRLGCDFGQGYGIAKPMPAEEVPKWLAQFNTPSAMNAG